LCLKMWFRIFETIKLSLDKKVLRFSSRWWSRQHVSHLKIENSMSTTDFWPKEHCKSKNVEFSTTNVILIPWLRWNW
jgi:hypothetical protein